MRNLDDITHRAIKVNRRMLSLDEPLGDESENYLGELLPDDERTADWDHSFDNLYFISFKNPKNSRLIGTFLDVVFRGDRHLYQSLMEGVKNEVESELEEEAFAFRTGRMADLGFVYQSIGR